MGFHFADGCSLTPQHLEIQVDGLSPSRTLADGALAKWVLPSVYRCVRPRWVGGTFGSVHDGGRRNSFVPVMSPNWEECTHREPSVLFMVRTGMNHRRRRRRHP